MAAELVGDARFSDDHLRGLQELSLKPGFIKKGAESLSFLSAGYSQPDLDICRKTWHRPKIGGIAEAIVAMPLAWSPENPQQQQFDVNAGYEFSGFERFLPTIAQRVAASFGLLSSTSSMDVPHWRGLMMKARKDICDILIRFPVLMHPSIQVQRSTGSKLMQDMLPLGMALKKSAFAVLPNSSLGYDKDTLTNFARHPCVEGTLHLPMTNNMLARTMLREHWLGQPVAGPLAEWSSSNIDFAISCGELNTFRKPDRRKRQWTPFLDPASAEYDEKVHARNRSAFCDLIMNIARGRSMDPGFVLKSADVQRLAKDPWMRENVFPSLVERRTFLSDDGYAAAQRCLLVIGELDLEKDRSKAATLLFQACCRHLQDPTNPEHAPSTFSGATAHFLQALLDLVGSPSLLRSEMETTGQVIPHRWQDLLRPHENAELMMATITASAAASPAPSNSSPTRSRARI